MQKNLYALLIGLALTLGSGLSAWAQTVYYVRTDGSNANTGLGNTSTTAKLTIAGALTAASNGDIIYVGPGTYTETTIAVSKRVTLIGSGNDTLSPSTSTIINNGFSFTASLDGSRRFIVRNLAITRTSGACVAISARKITLDRVIMRSRGGNGITFSGDHSAGSGDEFVLESCVINSCTSHGIEIPSSAEVSGLRIYRTQIINCISHAIGVPNNGGTGFDFNDIVISGCYIAGRVSTTVQPLYFERATNMTIENSTLMNGPVATSRPAVEISIRNATGNNITIRNCLVRNAGGATRGIRLQSAVAGTSANNVTITGCRFENVSYGVDNTLSGASSGHTYSFNDFSSYGVSGISSTGIATVSLAANRFANATPRITTVMVGAGAGVSIVNGSSTVNASSVSTANIQAGMRATIVNLSYFPQNFFTGGVSTANVVSKTATTVTFDNSFNTSQSNLLIVVYDAASPSYLSAADIGTTTLNASSHVNSTNKPVIGSDQVGYDNLTDAIAGVPSTGTIYLLTPSTMSGSLTTDKDLTYSTVGSALDGTSGVELTELTVSSGTTFRATGDIEITGDLINNGTYVLNGTKLTVGGNIAGVGSGIQAGTTASPSGSLEINGIGGGVSNLLFDGSNNVLRNFTISRSTGNVTLGSNLVVGEELTLSGGSNLNAGANTVTIGTAATATTLGRVSRTGTGYIRGTVKRHFLGTNSGTASGLIPVGTSLRYAPALVEFSTAPSAGGTLTAIFTEGIPANRNQGLPLVQGDITVDIASGTGSWAVNTSDGLTCGSCVYDMELGLNGFNGIILPARLVLLKRANSSSNWSLDGTHVVSSGTVSAAVIKRTGINTGFSEFGMGANSSENPLPVTLVSLQARQLRPGAAEVTWVTAQERNASHFIVERSVDEKSYWPVGEVVASGGTSAKAYSFVDETLPSGTAKVWYRLRSVDNDGTYETSKSVSLNRYTKGEQPEWEAWPVPATDKLNVTLADSEPVVLTLHDLKGRELMRRTFTRLAEIDLRGFESGVYSLRIQGSSYQLNRKVTVE